MILILSVLYNESVKAPFVIKLAGSATFWLFSSKYECNGSSGWNSKEAGGGGYHWDKSVKCYFFFFNCSEDFDVWPLNFNWWKILDRTNFERPIYWTLLVLFWFLKSYLHDCTKNLKLLIHQNSNSFGHIYMIYVQIINVFSYFKEEVYFFSSLSLSFSLFSSSFFSSSFVSSWKTANC